MHFFMTWLTFYNVEKFFKNFMVPRTRTSVMKFLVLFFSSKRNTNPLFLSNSSSIQWSTFKSTFNYSSLFQTLLTQFKICLIIFIVYLYIRRNWRINEIDRVTTRAKFHNETECKKWRAIFESPSSADRQTAAAADALVAFESQLILCRQ